MGCETAYFLFVTRAKIHEMDLDLMVGQLFKISLSELQLRLLKIGRTRPGLKILDTVKKYLKF